MNEHAKKLIDWHVSVALDPAVSSDAAALVLRITTAYEQGFGHAMRAELSNPYAGGTLEAEAWDHGREVGARKQQTAQGDPACPVTHVCAHVTNWENMPFVRQSDHLAAMAALQQQLGECDAGYRTLEREVESMRQEHIADRLNAGVPTITSAFKVIQDPAVPPGEMRFFMGGKLVGRILNCGEPAEQPSAIPVGGSLVHPDDAAKTGAAVGNNWGPMR